MSAVEPDETGKTCTSTSSSSWIGSISDGTGVSVPESHPHVIDIVPIADSDEETDIHSPFGNQVEEPDTGKSKLSQVNFDLAVTKTTANEPNDKSQVKTMSPLEAVNVTQPDVGHSKNSLIEILDTETEVVEIFPEAENNTMEIAPASINTKAPQHSAVSKSYIVQPGSYDLNGEDVDMSLELSPCVQKLSENCEHDRTGEQNAGELSGKCESLLPRLQGNARGGGRLIGGCRKPGQKLEKALNFLKKGANGGLRKSVAENANGSVLRSCLTGLSSTSLPGCEADVGETIEGSSTSGGVSISLDKCVENTGICDIACVACTATNSNISGCAQGSGKSTTASTSTAEIHMTGQVNRRKRKNPHSSVELCAGISQIPLHVKEEKIDDGYEEVSSSSKVVVLESRIGSDVSTGLGQNVSSVRGVQGERQEPVVSVFLATGGVSGKQRTMPSYRFTNFKVTATPRTIVVPSLVRPIRYSAPCLPAGGSQGAGSNPGGKLNVLLRSPPSVTPSRMLTAAANAIVSNRIPPRILPQTVPSLISPKPSSSAASGQSPLVILVNKRSSVAKSASSDAVGSVLQCNQPSSLSVILSSSNTSSVVAGGKTARQDKARSESATILTRKFQLLFKKSILSKLVSPKLMPESLYVSESIKPLTCIACGDEFVTEAGLNDHYDRKSVVISFICRCNKKTNIFYNMCSFARFYDEHRSQETRLQFYRQHTGHESCIVALLPNSLMSSEYQAIRGEKEKPMETEAPVVTPVVSVPLPPAPSISATTTEKDETSIPTLNEFFKALERHNCACLECSAEYKRRRGLNSHFSGQRGLASGLRFQCGKCFMVLPNICSFKSHSRIHDKLEPYVCPECGQIFRTSREVFMKHVKQVCLHFSRFQSRQCPICNVTLSHSLESMIAHLEHVHTQSYHKCSACTMAFPTVKSFRCHTAAQHSGDAVSKTIHKCPFCKVAQMDQKSLVEHIAQHVNDVGFGKPCDFRCLQCSTNFAARAELIEHMKSEHPTEIITGAMCEICGFVCDNTLTLFGHINTEHSTFFKQLFEQQTRTPPSAGNSPKVKDQAQAKASPNATLSKEQSSRSPAKSFECDRCQMALADGEKYERHMAKHRYMESKRGSSKTPPSSGKEKRRRIKDRKSIEEKHLEIKSEDLVCCFWIFLFPSVILKYG